MSRDASVGSVVARVTATDADSGLNARLVFAVVAGNHRSAFRVDPLTGVVTLAVPGHALDHAGYLLDVAVSDCGQPPLTSSVELTVGVTSPLMTSQAGGVGVSLIMIVVVVGVVASLVIAIVVVVVVGIVAKWRRPADVERASTATSKAPAVLDDDDDEALSAPCTHLPRSGDARSRDLPHSAATLNATGINDTPTWLGSLDCSVVSAPAACQVSNA